VNTKRKRIKRDKHFEQLLILVYPHPDPFDKHTIDTNYKPGLVSDFHIESVVRNAAAKSRTT
jgi:hypothetical protein